MRESLSDVHLVNYSDDRFMHRGGKFRERQLRFNDSARALGVGSIESWTFERLQGTAFYRDNKQTLDLDRFENGVPWKPYVVLEKLREIDEGQIVFYVDCVPDPLTEDPTPLVDLCREHGSVFAEWGDRNRNWTKRDAFALMGLDQPQHHHAPHLLNTWFLLVRCEKNLDFVEEWLRHNLDPNVASYKSTRAAGLDELPEYIENRGDQTILSLLASKHDYPTFPGTFDGLRNKDPNLFIRSLKWPGATRKLFRALHCESRTLRSTTGMDPRWMISYALSRLAYRLL